jgi:nucleotide-binding universal stress UspA family protein
MKLLVCINGHPGGLEAARTAGRLSQFLAGQVCFLYVRRTGHRSRGLNYAKRMSQVIASIQTPSSEFHHLAEARKAFSEAGGPVPDAGMASSRREALVQVGNGIFERATVDISASDVMTFRVREGFPHEEILKEADQQAYDLILLGGRRSESCNWFDSENIPLSVMKKSPCAVLAVQKPIPDPGAFLVMPGTRELSAIHRRMISDLALTFGSSLHFLSTSEEKHDDAQIPSGLNPKIAVTQKDADTNPLRFVAEHKAAYGLYICTAERTAFFSSVNHHARKIFCLGLNTLTLP